MSEGEQACLRSVYAHWRGRTLVGQHEVNYGRKIGADHMGSIQEEISV